MRQPPPMTLTAAAEMRKDEVFADVCCAPREENERATARRERRDTATAERRREDCMLDLRDFALGFCNGFWDKIFK